MMAYPCSSSPASASRIWNAAEGKGSSFRFGMAARGQLYRISTMVIRPALASFKAKVLLRGSTGRAPNWAVAPQKGSSGEWGIPGWYPKKNAQTIETEGDELTISVEQCQRMSQEWRRVLRVLFGNRLGAPRCFS